MAAALEAARDATLVAKASAVLRDAVEDFVGCARPRAEARKWGWEKEHVVEPTGTPNGQDNPSVQEVARTRGSRGGDKGEY